MVTKPNHDSNLAIEADSTEGGLRVMDGKYFGNPKFDIIDDDGCNLARTQYKEVATFIAHTKDKDSGYAAYINYSIGLEKEIAERDKKIAELKSEAAKWKRIAEDASVAYAKLDYECNG